VLGPVLRFPFVQMHVSVIDEVLLPEQLLMACKGNTGYGGKNKLDGFKRNDYDP
jgi:hypothetical protein